MSSREPAVRAVLRPSLSVAIVRAGAEACTQSWNIGNVSERSTDAAPSQAAPGWFLYQERVARFFRTLGVRARTNTSVQGARGKHDVDVLVEFESAGVGVTWIVECKAWKRPVGKDRVLVLAGVVEDVGADRGLIVSEAGYQAGAIRAAEHTNLTLTSLADLSENTAAERQRIAHTGIATRIYRLTTTVSRAWMWAPPDMPSHGLELERMIDFAADVFELNSIALPKLMNGDYPIAVSTSGGDHDRALDAAEGSVKIAARLDAAEAEALELMAQIEAAHSRAVAEIDALERDIAELLSSGRALGKHVNLAEERLLTRFATAMRSVGTRIEALRPAVPRAVRAEIREMHYWLIDEIYVVADQAMPDWDAAACAFESKASRVRGQLRACTPDATCVQGCSGSLNDQSRF